MSNLIVGCGYLGLQVAALWRERGAKVLATTRKPGGPVDFARLGLEPVVCDVLDPASLRKLPRADTVVYAVGFDRSSGASMRSVYVDGLANVLSHLPPPTRFLYVSSTSVYGQTDGSWVDEESPTAPLEDSGQIVLEAEAILRSTLPSAVILRFGAIYGTGRLLRQQSIELGEPIVGDSQKWLNLVHVADGAHIVSAAAESARGREIFNVCDGNPVKRREFYTELSRQLRAPAPRFTQPPPGVPAPPHERANRRITSAKLIAALGYEFLYPRYEAGIAASLSGPGLGLRPPEEHRRG